jgi:hypothetical protein
MKKYTLPIIILLIGIIVVVVSAFIKVQGSSASIGLLTGLTLEVIAIVLFLVIIIRSK